MVCESWVGMVAYFKGYKHSEEDSNLINNYMLHVGTRCYEGLQPSSSLLTYTAVKSKSLEASHHVKLQQDFEG